MATAASSGYPLLLLIFAFLLLISPWYVKQKNPYDKYEPQRMLTKQSNVKTSGSAGGWLPLVLLLLTLSAIYISSCLGKSVRAAPDSFSIGSSWGVGALLVMLILILWWQTTM